MNTTYVDILQAYQNQKLYRMLQGAAVLLILSWGIIAVLVYRPGPPPYLAVVENNTGRFLAVSKPIMGTDALMPSIVRWVLSEYIQNAFRIERNRDDEIRNLKNVYEISSADSGKLLTSFYQRDKSANDPIILAPKVHQQVNVTDVLALNTKDMYQVDFTTIRTHYDQEDGATTVHWKATMQVLVGRPNKTNPLGIYISNLDFAPEAQ